MSRFGLLPATRLSFMTSGYAISAWAPLIPHVKQQIGLSPAAFGLTLLAFGAGSMAMMPLAGGLIGRFGCRRLIAVGGTAIAVILPCLGLMHSGLMLAATLFCFGLAMGLLSSARNIHGIATERTLGRRLLSGFHGFYSVGCVLGAGTMSVLMGLGMPPPAAAAVVGVIILLAVAASTPQISDERIAAGPAYAPPRGVVLVIGLLCFVVFMCEGSVLDWSALMMLAHFRIDPARAGLAYVAFATMMTIGRLTGDRLVHKLGDKAMLTWSPLLATAGFVIATLPLHWTLAVFGFALVGAGAANIVPLLYSAVGRQKIMPPSLALTAAGSIGFAGTLSGPAAIGFIAQGSSLAVAFLVLAALVAVVARAAPRVVRSVDR
jgi:MFS family permease